MQDNYKTIKVEVLLRIEKDSDPEKVINECDYDFSHKDILDTELLDFKLLGE